MLKARQRQQGTCYEHVTVIGRDGRGWRWRGSSWRIQCINKGVRSSPTSTSMSFPCPARLSQSIVEFTPVHIVQYLIALLFITSRRSPFKQSGPSQKMPPHSTPQLGSHFTIPGTFPARCTQGLVLPATLTWCPQGARTKDDISGASVDDQPSVRDSGGKMPRLASPPGRLGVDS